MNVMSKALDEVKRRIPREILEVVFLKLNTILGQTQIGSFRPPLSIDEAILNQIIRTRVMMDTDILGGTEVYIPLSNLSPFRDPVFDYIVYFKIPKELTQGRTIVSALNLTYADAARLAAYGGATTVSNSAMMYAGQAAMNTSATIPMVSTAYVQLVGENTVMVKDATILPPNTALRCLLANDETMAHLQIRAIHPFCKLVELAVKSHIYNEYVIQLDIGQLYAGQNIGKIREIIDSYNDAEDLYETFLKEKWMKIMHMNDRETMLRTTKIMMGGFR